MATWFVSRHPGARAWAAQYALPIDQWVEHLDAYKILPGDTVIGTLPVHLAAEVCRRGGRYLHLTIDLPPDARGRELSQTELGTFNVRLEAFCVIAEPLPLNYLELSQ